METRREHTGWCAQRNRKPSNIVTKTLNILCAQHWIVPSSNLELTTQEPWEILFIIYPNGEALQNTQVRTNLFSCMISQL